MAAQASGTTSAMSTNSKSRIFFTCFGGSDVEKPWLAEAVGEVVVLVIGVVEAGTGPGLVRVVDGTVSRELLVEAHGIATTIATNSVVFSSVIIHPPCHKPITRMDCQVMHGSGKIIVCYTHVLCPAYPAGLHLLWSKGYHCRPR